MEKLMTMNNNLEELDTGLEDQDHRHGGPYDRGSADSYYCRGYSPHYFVGNTYGSEKVDLADMTADEITEYTKGFNENEADRNFKEW
tara:strand:+ start:405 stop:665 length:261 start_codon:yes stop_codon:yes gene_type:complete